MENIVITFCPLETDKDEVFKTAQEDKILIDAIKNFSRELSNNGIETFTQKHNIIVTEKGYYFAFYKKDLKLSR
jgi:hypothetical protein